MGGIITTGGVGETTQHGVAVTTCANTCAGVTSPVEKAIPIPNKTVASNVKTPTKIGFDFI